MKPIVVFLHGLGRTHRSLSGLQSHVEEAGYAGDGLCGFAISFPEPSTANEVSVWLPQFDWQLPLAAGVTQPQGSGT